MLGLEVLVQLAGGCAPTSAVSKDVDLNNTTEAGGDPHSLVI
jgi:hypothetical protein